MLKAHPEPMPDRGDNHAAAAAEAEVQALRARVAALEARERGLGGLAGSVTSARLALLASLPGVSDTHIWMLSTLLAAHPARVTAEALAASPYARPTTPDASRRRCVKVQLANLRRVCRREGLPVDARAVIGPTAEGYLLTPSAFAWLRGEDAE